MGQIAAVHPPSAVGQFAQLGQALNHCPRLGGHFGYNLVGLANGLRSNPDRHDCVSDCEYESGKRDNQDPIPDSIL
jgi:hypothetical protein